MTKLQTILSALLALATIIIIGCANLPPTTYNADDFAFSDTSFFFGHTNTLNITYTEHCNLCKAPIPLSAQTPAYPAICHTCALTQYHPLSEAWRAAQIARLTQAPPPTPPKLPEYLPDPRSIPGTHPVAGVLCGLDYVNPIAYGGWSGACPGAALDAWLYNCILTSYDLPATALYNEYAYYQNIINQTLTILPQIKLGGCLWLTISGHGTRTPDLNGDEDDGYDEQICLFNGRLKDDNVWYLLNHLHSYRPDIHILMISDTCHSGSNYRTGPLRLTDQPPSSSGSLAARPARTGLVHQALAQAHEPNLLHFAACPAASSAWGSPQGGIFTTALIDTFSTDLTYAKWFSSAAALMPPNQRPVIESTGTDFRNRRLFDF